MSNMDLWVLDIETSPNLAFTWGAWKQNVAPVQMVRDWYILSWSAKKWGSDETISRNLTMYETWKDDIHDDRELVEELWHFLNRVDAIVAHNGKAFDLPKINARVLKHGLPPYAPVSIIDTKLIAKKAFGLTFNSLLYLAKYLGLDIQKMDAGGFETWVGCYRGEQAAFDHMSKYNDVDVLVLEEVYRRLLPWAHSHPNHGLYTEGDRPVCDKCGSTHIQWRGTAKTAAMVYRRFQCQSCGGWGRDRNAKKETDRRTRVTANAVR